MIIDIDTGGVTTFEPEFSTYGGQSGFTAINDNGTIVGYASVGIEPDSQEIIDDRCLNQFVDKVPLEVCTGGFSHSSFSNPPTSYYLRAFSWQYVGGELTNPTPLGILASPIDDEDTSSYKSIALDINNAGVAVGRSIAFRKGVKEIRQKFDVAVVFKDGEIIDLMDHDNDEWLSSRAVAINDSGLVIGSVSRLFSGFSRNKFFVFDINSTTTDLEFPNDLRSSVTDFSSNANSINNDNVVVGNVEIDAVKSGTVRRTHGFIYDHKVNLFQDINNTMTCASLGFTTDSDGNLKKHTVEIQGGDGVTLSFETEIVIVDASDITDDGTIMATAFVKLPKIATQWVDAQGEVTTAGAEGATEQVVLDANGNPVFAVDGSGQAITEQLPRAVVLKPTTEQACEVSGTDSPQDKSERKGASFGWLMLLLSLAGLGRRKFLK